ncbi:MAG: cytochrome c-type biogenesis protein [Alphaproteobacteria bacterium]|nr:cytochrome c-type biogenesis protein [Alphaproteobacteria bacterium]
MIAALAMAIAVGADTPLPDAGEEARAQGLMREIRCVVCENEPVSQSTADIAVDMRRTIRSQVEQGASDGEVRTYFSDRYGQFVLFRPPARGLGILLWIFPFALLAAAGGVIAMRAVRGRRAGLTPLPDDRLDGDGG